MTFNLFNMQTIINHLKKISSRFDDKGNEIVIYCPFCDDSTRPGAHRHGHCYIAKKQPVFFCFRCSSSGTILKLLIETDFDDEETIEYLKQILSYKFIRNYKISKKSDSKKIDQIYSSIIEQNLSFLEKNRDKFNIFRQYLISRLGDIDYVKFLIYPGMFKNKFLCCNFMNSDGELVIQRLIENSSEQRYIINKNSNNLYYFQNRDFEKFRKLVLAEGPFDVISLYLYNNMFRDCFFVGINGKKYISTLEKFIIEDLLIGKFEVNFIFDKDVLDYNKYLQRGSKLAQIYNPEIKVKGFVAIEKDTGDFPSVIEVKEKVKEKK